jgi:signal transduction histidine kinase
VHERGVTLGAEVGRVGSKTKSKARLERPTAGTPRRRTSPSAAALRKHLAEVREQFTATSEILRVISQSPTDAQPVFDTIVRNAVRLCGGMFANVLRFDGELLHYVASSHSAPGFLRRMRDRYPMRPDKRQIAGRVVLARATVTMEDALADADYDRTMAIAGRWRRMLGVPMIRDGNPIGVIVVGWAEPGPVATGQEELLRTFADQAVIAIENVRLFTEVGKRNRDLTEALEQQTATSEILRVISRTQTDVQPVFETIVRSVLSLCDAAYSGVYLVEGNVVRLAATAGLSAEQSAAFERGFPRKLGTDTVSGRAALECRLVQTADIANDPDYAGAPGIAVGAHAVLAVPLVRDGRAIGAIGVWRAEVKPFSDTQIALLRTFADQAVIAIENVRLFTELEARTRDLSRSVGELEALGEVGQAVSSTLDLETVLRTIVSRATHLAGMGGGSIWEYDEAREEFHLHATDRLSDELVEALRATPIRKGEGVLGRLALTGEPVEIQDIVGERTYPSRVKEAILRNGYRAVLAVPLLRENHLLGALAVNRTTPGEFAPEVVELLKTFATQSALAIQNARLYREIEVKSREVEVASRHKSEFLANMSHELRTPLNAIIGFSEVLTERMFGELNAKQAEYVGDILDSGRHLLSLINDILDLSKIEAGRMELEPSEFYLPGAIENALTLVRERAGRRAIAVAHDIDARLGPVRADERKVKQVLLNLLSNALKFTPEGGRIDVRAGLRDGVAEIAVADTGVGIAPEDQAAVFEEFRQVGTAAKKVEGTGLGLAIARKFVELHGGRIWVDSRPGAGATFTFTLPVQSSEGNA